MVYGVAVATQDHLEGGNWMTRCCISYSLDLYNLGLWGSECLHLHSVLVVPLLTDW